MFACLSNKPRSFALALSIVVAALLAIGMATARANTSSEKTHPAKLQVLRAQVDNGRLDVLADITKRADGDRVRVHFLAKGKRFSFTAPVSDGRIRFKRALPKSQQGVRTGIMEMVYEGNERMRPTQVRLRAASGKALLKRDLLSLQDGVLAARGSLTNRAEGVVRLILSYERSNGSVGEWQGRATVRDDGTWGLEERLSAEARAGGYLSIQFTGYYPRRIRGEQIAKQLLAGQSFDSRNNLIPGPTPEPEPTPSPQPTPEPEPVRSLIWAGGFEPGDLSEWGLVQTAAPDRAQIVRSPVTQGTYALKLTVKYGDVPTGTASTGSATNRAQINGPTIHQEGEEDYTRVSMRVPSGFPVGTASNDFQLAWQWHGAPHTGSPPVSINMNKDRSQWQLAHNPFEPNGDTNQRQSYRVPISLPLTKDVWHHFVYRVKWSRYSSVGFFEVWHAEGGQEPVKLTVQNGPGAGGQRVLGPTLHSNMVDGLRPIAANYRRQDTTAQDGTIFYDGVAVGNSFSSVWP